MVVYGSNKSFVLRGIQDVVFGERPVPKIADDEILVEVKKTGICGSDVHFYAEGRRDGRPLGDPFVLGHESSGIVFEVGPGVKSLKPGQKVAIEPGQACRKCLDCKSGRYQLCGSMVFPAVPGNDGTLVRYYKAAEDMVYPLPDNMDLEDGAMMEPLSVAVHAIVSVSKMQANQIVAVFGAGPIGLLCMAVAKALGARRVIAIDINEARLKFAKEYAATDIFLPSKPKPDESRVDYARRNAEEIMAAFNLKLRGPDGVDLVLEASGAEVCTQSGILLAKAGGVFTQIGMGGMVSGITIMPCINKELTIHGSFRYGPGDYPLAISLVSSGKIDLKPLVSHRYAFDDALPAFIAAKNAVGQDGKPVIKAMISGPV